MLLLLWFAALQAAPPEAVTPRSIPYYDPAWAKALSLEALKARVESRERIDGVDVLAVTYSAFEQVYAVEGGTRTLPWRQKALLFLPPAKSHQAVLFNGHDGIQFKEAGTLRYGAEICRAFGIPVLLHGWEPDVVKALDGLDYGNAQRPLFDRLLRAKIEKAMDLPMDGRYLLNGLPLVKGDMVSITLLQRLAARERGMAVKEVGTVGISKEGWSHWILAAVDDRVAVVSPGGHYLESFRDTFERYRADWNGEYPTHLPHGELFRLFLRIGDWTSSTEAGRKVDRANSPEHWPEQIRARHVLVSGDLGAHDGPFPVLSENRFLSGFKHPSWRYARVFDGAGLSDLSGEMCRSLLPHVADLLVTGAATPTTPTVAVEEEGRRVRVKARSKAQAGAEGLIFFIVSPERTLRAPGLAWSRVAMAAPRPGEFESPLLPEVPAGHGLTFLVVVREPVEKGALRFWRSASSLPEERFPRPEHQGRLPPWNEGR